MRPVEVEMHLSAEKAFRAILDRIAAANVRRLITTEIAGNPRLAADSVAQGIFVKSGTVDGEHRKFDYTITYSYRFGEKKMVVRALAVT